MRHLSYKCVLSNSLSHKPLGKHRKVELAGCRI